MPLCSEADELSRSSGLPQTVNRGRFEQGRVPLVDRVEVEILLAAGEVEEVLAVEGRDELLGLRPVVVEVQGLAA